MRTATENLRKYGKAPFRVALVHGGPGAAGELAPVARELASGRGVMEPLQSALSLTGQVAELRTVLEENGDLPITLIGHSWGAWLSFIMAANYPTIVKNLILIDSGSFEEKYAATIQETRLNRLSEGDRAKVEDLLNILDNPAAEDKSNAFARLGELLSIVDAYDPVMNAPEIIDYRVDIFQSVWPEAAELRSSGQLLELGKQIQCPVVAIHGDYDPHSAEGVQRPLAGILKEFRFILLKNCGHKPWIEKGARDQFYRILKEECVDEDGISTDQGLDF